MIENVAMHDLPARKVIELRPRGGGRGGDTCIFYSSGYYYEGYQRGLADQVLS